jgi:hypothetical protein
MDLRGDFSSVKHHFSRIQIYGDAFRKFDLDWSHLKNREDFNQIYALDDSDRRPFETIYSNGRDCAVFMASQLNSFNYADQHPTLSHFVHSFDKSWVTQTDKLEHDVDSAKQKAKDIDLNLFSTGQMIVLFEKQIEILKATKKTLNALKRSKLYREENGIKWTLNIKEHFNFSYIVGAFSIIGVIFTIIVYFV